MLVNQQKKKKNSDYGHQIAIHLIPEDQISKPPNLINDLEWRTKFQRKFQQLSLCGKILSVFFQMMICTQEMCILE